MADANIYIAGASISPTSVQTGAKYAIAVDVRNVRKYSSDGAVCRFGNSGSACYGSRRLRQSGGKAVKKG